MQTVTLQFPDLKQLVRFRQTLDDTSWEINFTQLTITCRCSEQIVAEAIEWYGAKRVQLQEQ